MNPRLFLADLEAKPAALNGLALLLEREDPWAAVQAGVRRVVMLGMGSSRYAAQVAARRLRLAGVDASAEYASAEGAVPAGDDTLVIAVSASGTSRETLDAVAGLQRFAALTNDPDSELAKAAVVVVPMAAGAETGGVACRTFQHTQALLHALVGRLAGDPGAARATAGLVRRAAAATADLLDRRDQWLPGCAQVLGDGDGVFPMAPVERLSSALQSALMFREGPRLMAAGSETGDWSHVDVYLTKTLRYRALLFPGSRYDGQALQWLHERGSTVVTVGAQVAGAAATIRYRHDDDPGVRLLTETLPAELVAARWWLEQSRA